MLRRSTCSRYNGNPMPRAIVADLGGSQSQKMLVYEPSKRITAREALRHPYFDELNKVGFHRTAGRALMLSLLLWDQVKASSGAGLTSASEKNASGFATSSASGAGGALPAVSSAMATGVTATGTGTATAGGSSGSSGFGAGSSGYSFGSFSSGSASGTLAATGSASVFGQHAYSSSLSSGGGSSSSSAAAYGNYGAAPMSLGGGY